MSLALQWTQRSSLPGEGWQAARLALAQRVSVGQEQVGGTEFAMGNVKPKGCRVISTPSRPWQPSLEALWGQLEALPQAAQIQPRGEHTAQARAGLLASSTKPGVGLQAPPVSWTQGTTPCAPSHTLSLHPGLGSLRSRDEPLS